MQTIRLTTAQALLKFLDQQYVEFDSKQTKFVQGVMGIFGHGNVTGLGEALEYGNTEIKYIQGHNEQGIVHTATAFAKQMNRRAIFACTSSVGPGAMNMITGAATATVNRIPVLLLPGDVFACRQPDPVLQQLEVPHDYTISSNDCFKPVSKYFDRVERPEQLMTACINAFRVLTNPEITGAVTLSLPQDVQAEAYDYPLHFFQKRIHYIDRKEPQLRALDAAVKLISEAKRPLIIAGGGVIYSEAGHELNNLANDTGIPVAETQAGKSCMNWCSPMSIGGIGVTGTLAANELAMNSDLIIACGTRLSDFTTGSKSAFRTGTPILSINISPFDGLKMDAHFVEGDARKILRELNSRLKNITYSTDEKYQSEIKVGKENWNKEVDRLYHLQDEKFIHQTAVVGALNEFMSPEDVVVCASGSLPGDLHRLWRSENVKSYHMEYGYSCMGYEIAGGLGVKIAQPETEIYILVGDGSFLMLHSELITSLQENLKINIILLDNNGFQCIKNLQKGNGSQGFGNELRYRDPNSDTLNGEIIPIDFAKIADGLGIKSFKANNLDEFKQNLEKTKKETTSTLIEIKVKPGTMSDGYESWWRVGIAEISNSSEVAKASQKMNAKIKLIGAY
jgi:3D-(3,5/4)-trihydroxycyclohexane-1,2-dione acylhydrolase (decyclizing)